MREATAGRIGSLLDPGPLASAILVLTNAICFRGLWANPFDPAKTEDSAFHLPSGRQRTLPLMRRHGEMPFFEDGQVQVVRLPYGKGRYSLTVVLPRSEASLPDLARALTPYRWWAWQQRCRRQSGELWLPRFRLAYGADLVTQLNHLGLFAGGSDFGDMGAGALMISHVIHKARFEVDEVGTTAAAATAVAMTRGAIIGRPFRMVVDRPFLCGVVDAQTKTTLFLALVMEP